MVHTSRILRLSEDLPVVIEMVDTAVRIEAERVHVLTYRAPDSTTSG